jgi:SAM-dependent methyltransferase
MAAGDWISFWDSKHSIYVGPKHHTAHFRRIAADMRQYAPAGGTMLDYGCGEALSAAELADGAGRLILCEAAPNVRAMLAGRYASNPKIVVRKPADVATMPGHSVDTLVMHSVSQYLGEAEFEGLLRTFHRLVKPGGLLVLGDVIPKRVSAFGDGIALLRFGAQEGFYWAAVRGLLRTYFSNYWKLRKSLGLRRYDEADVIAKLKAAGFDAQRAPTNIGHNRARMTFLARPA